MRLRQRALGRHDGRTIGFEPLPDAFLRDRVLNGGRQLCDDLGRRACRNVQALPDRELEREATFCECRHVGEHRQPRRCSNPVGLDRARLDLRGSGAGLVAHDIDAPADHVEQRRRRSAICHAGERVAKLPHEDGAAQIGDIAGPSRGQHDFVALLLEVGQQLFQGGGRQVLAGDQDHGDFGRQADRDQVPPGVVRQVGVDRRGGRHANMMKQHRVPVRLRVRHAAGGERAASPVRVDQQQTLPQIDRHRLGDDPGDVVDRSTGRARHHERYRLGRKIRRTVHCSGLTCQSGQRQDRCKYSLHGYPPYVMFAWTNFVALRDRVAVVRWLNAAGRSKAQKLPGCRLPDPDPESGRSPRARPRHPVRPAHCGETWRSTRPA